MLQLNELLKKFESLLSAGSHDSPANQALIDEAKAFMNTNPESRVKLGPLVGKLKSMPKQNPDLNLNWVALLNGCIAIGHRPKVKMLENMKACGATHIFTLLSEKEGAKDIGRATVKNGLSWLWLSLESAEPPEPSRFEEIDDIFNLCVKALQNGAQIYIHCSAGIHRTGMIAYALFRYVGLDSGKSTSLLQQLRDVTSENVGEHRKDWGDTYANQLTKG
ncbi:tyrosine-protein phosphatase [Aliiglaciecola sp. 2_MG-2023]|uniref:protein-tyrosine phosphatase family protein n=1 Tax=unclassified Aliiglaciecola TaxID=2593648 RepID=UPI0026E1B0D4|nr:MULTISPECIES: tyrosine-protein phosphatase [unclassified Aliiglaciecola]MDO6712748.1 tyrosine-protein phosphatase [Aliiglaciecola sp. 2_MG-2023]MDO6753853.1 tyrosine-protein phosphatase [Aliiglaciecola sp. 1_MG-2023]